MQILSLAATPKDKLIAQAVAVLHRGGLVIYPTETTYGIGVDATNQQAVDALLKYKKRREGKPLSIAVADQKMAQQYVALNDTARSVYRTFLPGPVTVVSLSTRHVAKGVESEMGTLGVRISSYPLVTELVRAFGKPVTATGANASYKKRPYTIADILDHLSPTQTSRIDLIIDAGELPHNEPSTVIDTTMEQLTVLRQGEIRFSQQEETKTTSEQETQEFGKRLIQRYKNILSYKALIICLEGEMGAGKTQCTKGIAQGLGIHRTISSPTFVLSRSYPFEAEGKQLEFVHIDTWRMEHQADEELKALGFTEAVDACGVICIEWADRVLPFLQTLADEAKIIWVKFSYGKQENERIIQVSDEPFSTKTEQEKSI